MEHVLVIRVRTQVGVPAEGVFRLCPAQGCPEEGGRVMAETPATLPSPSHGCTAGKEERATYSHSHQEDNGLAGS